MTPKDKVLEAIDNEDFFRERFSDIDFDATGEAKVSCFMHADGGTPNLGINVSGVGHCFSCGGKFKDILGFAFLWNKHTAKELSYDNIVKSLYHKYVHPIADPALVNRWHKNLLKNPTKQKELQSVKMIDLDDIEKHKIGYDPDTNRFTVPITTSEGWVHDIRKISIDKGNKFKNMPLDGHEAKDKKARGELTHGKGSRLFPIANMNKQQVIVCEGEWDAIMLDKHGFNGVSAGGITNWNQEVYRLKGKDVIVMFDNDVKDNGANPGQEAAEKMCDKIYYIAKSVKNVVLPKGDVSDFFEDGGTAEALSQMIGASQEPILEPEEEKIIKVPTIASLQSDKYYGKRVAVDCKLTGESEDHYTIPKDWALICDQGAGNSCNECPMNKSQGRIQGRIEPGSVEALEMIEEKDANIIGKIRKENGNIPKCSRLRYERETVSNLHTVSISPTMQRDNKATEVDRLIVWNTCERLETNAEYTFTGRVTHDPLTQKTVFIIEEAKQKELSFRSFKTPSKKKREELKRKFGPKEMTVESILEKHYEMMELLAHNVTYIYGRPHLHTAMDLTFHSPLQMELDGVVRNTFIETLVIGDTNTGKNEVLDRLCQHYAGGVVVDSGATTRAGLIGGESKGMFKWGLYVRQTGMLIGLDEGTHLAETIADLRCIREGKADYVKNLAQRQTVCMTRLVILANDPGGSLSMNAYPVTAMKHLFKAGADMSRFTMAYFMREEDVDSDVINRSHPPLLDTAITQDDFQLRLSNAWALHHSNIIVDKATTETVYKEAKAMASKYSSAIPLVQDATMKHKLPALGGALAATQYNMSEDGTQLIVTSEYMKAARILLEEHYDSPACNYLEFSKKIYANNTIANTEAVDAIFENEATDSEGNVEHSIEHLLSARDLDAEHVADSFMHCTNYGAAKVIIKKLIMNRCLVKNNNLYQKTPAFEKYLKEKRSSGETFIKLPRHKMGRGSNTKG